MSFPDHHHQRRHWPKVFAGWVALAALVGGGVWWVAARGDSTAAVPADAVTHRDLAYATVSPSQTLDLSLPATTDSRDVPLIVVIHGGGFYSGDKQELTPAARALVDAGFAVATLNYRLTAEARFPAGAQEVIGLARLGD